MINSKEIYFNCGKECGTARRLKDESRTTFEKNWFNSAVYLENQDDKAIAREEFKAGYEAGRGTIRPAYF